MVSGAISGTVGEAFDAFNDNRDDGNQSLGERIGAVGVNTMIAGMSNGNGSSIYNKGSAKGV
ncbi:hypothetical protein [Lysinibacillus capsici]|uniref:hypothetical protein n=1 Tax=Lysinibacillus capsici TaxID=2115968 RepID=UPI00289FDC38|nr:hypothetical protein [Lysinibacillus capsici]